MLPIWTSPDASARKTPAPLSNLRQSTLAPLSFAKLLSACATFAGSAEVWYATVTLTASARNASSASAAAKKVKRVAAMIITPPFL